MFSNPNFDRILILIKTGRYDEAIQLLRQDLSQNPDNPVALGLLAVCFLDKGQREAALTPAGQAVGLSPDDPWLLCIHSRVLMLNNKIPEARQSAQAALQFNPTYTTAYELLSQLAYHEKKWEEALKYAEGGLAHDPEDADLVNLRAMSLMKLNRINEAAETVDYALKQDPEDTFSHSNKGWVLIEQGRYDEAVLTFREALRFAPGNEYARDGLKEAIKGKNWLYRGVLRYALFMGKLSERNQWLLIIGAYVVIRIISNVADSNKALQPFLMPLVGIYLVFAFATWIGVPLSNLVLRLHPIGKHALTAAEKRDSSLIGINLGVSVLALLLGQFIAGDLSQTLITLGIALLVMLVPIGGYSLSDPKGSARRTLAYLAIALFIFGPGSQLMYLLTGSFKGESTMLTIFMIGIFFYGWIANYILMRDRNRFH